MVWKVYPKGGVEIKLASTVPTGYHCGDSAISFPRMEKKQIDSPKMTLNFLIWVGGVFMLLIFALLGHFVWGIF
jgi:hypothetical protein